MRAIVFGFLALALCAAAPALADERLPTGFPAAGLAAFSPLMAGIEGGAVCDFTINRGVGAAFISARLGAHVAFDAEGASFLLWMAAAQRVLQAEMGAIPAPGADKSDYCDQMIESFGPGGKTIPGLVAR